MNADDSAAHDAVLRTWLDSGIWIADKPVREALDAVLAENARMREERPLLGPTYANGWADALRAVRMPGLHEREAAWRKFREVVIDAAPQQTARDAANGDAECECGCRPGQTCTCSVHDCECIGDCPVCDADEAEHAPGGEAL
jgi:hypothetical protein